jgi:hypothetical protein
MSHSSQDDRQPKDFDIEEVEISSDNVNQTVVEAGTVETWKRLDLSRKDKIRLYITSIVIGIWLISISAGLLRWAIAGDFSLLICSPVLLSRPLRMVLTFYFTE